MTKKALTKRAPARAGRAVVPRAASADTFRLNPKQRKAVALLSSDATYIMLYGGSRSGKTFLFVRAIIIRALMFPGSRHAIFRLRFNHVKASVVLDTFPKVMRLCFPTVRYDVNKSDWYAEFANGSQVWFGGLDEKDRTEKVLGQEYATVYLVELSQLSYNAYLIALTRLAQLCEAVVDGELRVLRLKLYGDCNPPSKAHWSYKLWETKVDPQSNVALDHPEEYASMRLNPRDNVENLPKAYIKILEGMPRTMRLRFLDGMFLDRVDGALWSPEVIDAGRVQHVDRELLRRVVVAVDPPGGVNTECGIVGAGVEVPHDRARKPHGYVLEDRSMRGKPDDWGKAAVQLYRDLAADCVVAEANFGGDMVESTIQHVDPNVPVRMVHASRGKARRAEPISVLYENGRISHVGLFPEMEDEMCTFVEGETKASPNRMDAFVWAMTELMGVVPVDVSGATVLGNRLATEHKPWSGASPGDSPFQHARLSRHDKPW